jgi:hypothetical protein
MLELLCDQWTVIEKYNTVVSQSFYSFLVNSTSVQSAR